MIIVTRDDSDRPGMGGMGIVQKLGLIMTFRNGLSRTRGELSLQGDHSPGKPGKVREFQSGQGKWKKSGKSQGK